MAAGIDDAASDYSLDFSSGDEALLCELVDAVSKNPPHHPAPTSLPPLPSPQPGGAPEQNRNGLETDYTTLCAPSAPGALQGAALSPAVEPSSLLAPAPAGDGGPAIAVVETRGDTSPVRRLEEELTEKALAALPQADPLDLDALPPLTRFRSFPRKALTVTDLTSGAWCELQYYYTLTRLPGGRKTRTKEMTQGSKVHKVLEDQVHETVRVEVMSREDAVGVRAWNLVQGLQALAETGLTREMQVWGVISGQVVSGIIDGVGWENPDGKKTPKGADQPKAKSGTIENYFPSSQDTEDGAEPPNLVYLTDVKTRGSSTMPIPAAMWPAKVQLYLYHRFLEDMITNKLSFLKVFRRYGADPDEPFSDTFLSQMASMHEEMFDGTPESSQAASPPETPLAVKQEGTSLAEPPSSDPSYIPPSTDLSDSASLSTLKYRTLREIIPLIQSSLAAAFPQGTASIADRLCIEYRHRADGRLVARKIFNHDPKKLDDFVTKDFEWWRGERAPRGVEIEETFKCRSCEFSDECQWRQDQDLKRLNAAREKLLKKRKESDDIRASLGV